MKTINEIYEERKNTPSDINEHLESLYELALECRTIAEFVVLAANTLWLAFFLSRSTHLSPHFDNNSPFFL
jgi:hypothetical protein